VTDFSFCDFSIARRNLLVRIVVTILMTASFSWPALAGQCEEVQPSQAQQSVAFQATDKPVTLKQDATLLDRPFGQAVFRVALRTHVNASGKSVDGCWWQIILPDGRFGYVSANQVGEN
jgi:hypothetical protein